MPSAWGPGENFVGSIYALGALGRMSYRTIDCEYTKSNYWALIIASSFVVTFDKATSFIVYGNRDFTNQSAISVVIIPLRCLHSCIWSDICVEVFWRNDVKSSVLVSYRTGSWKCFRNAMDSLSKLANKLPANSIYHVDATPVNVRWKSLNLILLSISELEENHRWKFMIWLARSSPALPSNFGMSDGNLVGTRGQPGICWKGSFLSLLKSGRLRVARNISLVWENDPRLEVLLKGKSVPGECPK